MLDPRYVAGLFDGEGNINIAQSNASMFLVVRVQIYISNKEVLQKMAETYPLSSFNDKRQGCAGNVDVFQWAIRGYNAASFIETIEPHCIVKRDDIAWFWRWFNLPRSSRGNKTPSAELIQARTDFYKEYKEWREVTFKRKPRTT